MKSPQVSDHRPARLTANHSMRRRTLRTSKFLRFLELVAKFGNTSLRKVCSVIGQRNISRAKFSGILQDSSKILVYIITLQIRIWIVY